MLSRTGAILLPLLLCMQYVKGSDVDKPVVQTSYGKVQGKLDYTVDSTKPVNTFLGIPYAAPPVGENRFLKPQPLQPWTKVTAKLDATKPRPSCPQDFPEVMEKVMVDMGFPTPDLHTSEDCLFLNIHTASLSTKQPVLVWIHGGGFGLGDGISYDGVALASFNDIVVVTINYRLGILGYFSTLDENAPGNAGMWDQVAALKWVQENIAQFGGDPEKVTIAGESAGGMSVAHLMASPVAKGLFKRAMPQSGSNVDVPFFPKPLDNAKLLAEELNCSLPSNKEIVDCLRQLDSEEFISVIPKLPMTAGWSPIQDGEFYPETANDLYKQNKMRDVDLMVGVNTHEGHLLVKSMNPNMTGLENRQNFSSSVNDTLLWFMQLDNAERALQKITDFYLGSDSEPSEEFIIRRNIEFFGHFILGYPTFRLAQLHAASGAKTYFYNFHYRPSYSKTLDWVVTDHGDDLCFSFGMMFTNKVASMKDFTDNDKKTSMVFMKYISNFVKNGDPNSDDLPLWPVHSSEKGEYLKLSYNPEVATKFDEEAMRFWQKFWKEENARPRDEL